MSCPDFEALSAFTDGESPPAECASVEKHLSGCAACRATVESIAAERRALSGMAVPPMPADLKASLEELVPRPAPRADAASEGARHLALPELEGQAPAGVDAEPAWRRWLSEIWAYRTTTALAAAAACVALLLWTWKSGVFAPRIELPAEFLAAAHNQYALSLRLAPSEKIMTEMPAQLSAGIPEGRDVY